MVWYIRYLRTPQVSESAKKTIDVSAVLAVTSDLGDSFYCEDVELKVRVVEAHHPHRVLQSMPVTWRGGSRAVKFAVQCSGKYTSRPVKAHVAANGTEAVERPGVIPEILDVWSVEFRLVDKQRSESMVDRQLLLSNNTRVRIHEETGDSIARHIWDASLGFLMYFRKALESHSTQPFSAFRALITSQTIRRLNVLELGAGCGIVGIALAQLIKCDMLLTDLEDASEILDKNIGYATPAPGSTLRAGILDWSIEIHDSFNTKFDLILVSDCIYNPDTSVHLVETLKRLTQSAPNASILVGFKRRHEADSIFFDYMQATKFEVVETFNIPLPHHVTEQDVAAPTVEFFTYRRHLGP